MPSNSGGLTVGEIKFLNALALLLALNPKLFFPDHAGCSAFVLAEAELIYY